MNNFVNSGINGAHFNWWIKISYWKNWSNGDSVKISLASRSVGGQL